MANLFRRYKSSGPSVGQLNSLVGDNMVSAVSAADGHQYVDVTVSDTVVVSTLNTAMSDLGWSFFESDPPTNLAPTVEQVHHAALASNTAIGTSFEDVCTVTLDSRGNSYILVDLSAYAASISLSADIQLVIDGGALDNVTVGPIAMPLLAGGGCSFSVKQALPTETNRETYTVKLQARRASLGALTLLAAATSLKVIEYR